ncbi:MAG: TlpA family protein disulfide reductase [Candidatus Scalindua sp. AMX11]|nr:MAG: TlpA family protein disulfide reductase [Candidatus Scalindua sp.]NOG84853.1 TlpA family protein disulfide reductase [Planctomycetota bacterium]RZV84923.1 MAG: TlpA family protein disulfide reductase [Candidatus Scalindua sp. SCAELEC01]TDE65085.1 MAG: TlpA family protein disulfide reductase [Candidatus Scalindua sp. AMX11]GJQ59478.1 MAG: hypothetical protein SCALA701_22790 [Candidatus Scalindua sp.]
MGVTFSLLTYPRVFFAVLLIYFSLDFFQNTPLYANAEINIIGAESLKKEITNSKSKILVVDFWATFCKPCEKQVPVYSLIQTKFRPDDVSIIGVSLDFDKSRAKKFVQVQGIKYPTFLSDEDLSFHFNVNSIPTTHIYNDDRKLVQSYIGFVGEEELTETIEKLLRAQ